MRLELVCALLVIAVVSIATSAEDIGSQNDVDDERSVRDALGSDDGESALGDDDGRSVRDDNRHLRHEIIDVASPQKGL
ncbi:hypothetical protein EMCRGX_G020559 [Ephydatia muelleri]